MVEVQTSAPEQKTSGGRSKTTTIVIVIVVILVLGTGGWLVSKYLAGRLAKEATEGILGGITDSKVDLDSEGNIAKITDDDGSFEISAGGKWPSDIPTEVPEFTAGIIESSSKSKVDEKGGWSLLFSKVETGAYESYKQQLLAKGWSETSAITTNSKIANMENDKYYLVFTVDESDSTGSLVISDK
jgi:hypothetical protein